MGICEFESTEGLFWALRMPNHYFPIPSIVLKSGEALRPAVAAMSLLKSIDADKIILKKVILIGKECEILLLLSSGMFRNQPNGQWIDPIHLP